MIYILSLLLSLGFLYSPKTEKKGAVFFVQPVKISIERKTPAYILFSKSKIIQEKNTYKKNQITHLKTPIKHFEVLTIQSVDQYKIDFPKATVISEMKLNRSELNESTNKELVNMAYTNRDSTLLNKVSANQFVSPFLQNQKSDKNSVSVQGYFELIEGVGLIDQTVTLRRVKEGQTLEVGQIDLKAGMYQIYVNSIEGDLVAEIKDQNGIIIGEDRKKLIGLVRKNHFFLGPELKLGKPNGFALNLKMVDDSKIPNNLESSIFSGHYLLKKTTDNYPNVVSHSSTVALINDKDDKIARTLSVRMADDQSDILLFSKKWILGATEYISDKIQIQYMEDTGVIVGRVVADGKPVFGAQVVIENQPGTEPYYLDQFLIPKTDQTSTSQNGFFIIPGLQNGSYQISAFLNNRHIGSQTYFVESSILSYQEIRGSFATKAHWARSFDVFSGAFVETEIQVPGLEDIVKIIETGSLYNDPSLTGITEILNRPVLQGYLPYRYMQNSKKDFVHFPQLSELFLDHLKNQIQKNYSISVIANTSLYFGFVQMNKYEVDLADETYDKNQIIYFDSMGHISKVPITNGGFLMMNVPTGSQEIIVHNKENDRTNSQVFFSLDSQIYLSHFVD